jgi:hypothetical protein
VADAQHAAVAIAEGCTWVTRDRDFTRFARHGLRWEHLVLKQGFHVLRLCRSIDYPGTNVVPNARPWQAIVLSSLWFCGWPGAAHGQEASAALYGAAASDMTNRIMPSVRLKVPLIAETEVEVSYAVDALSRASIAQTTGVDSRVTERWHELAAALGGTFHDLHLRGIYRHTWTDPIISHTAVLEAEHPFAQEAALLSVSAYARANALSDLRDANVHESNSMFGARVGFRQLLDGQTIAELRYEIRYAHGFLSNPFAYVGIRGSGAGCVGAILCIPERNPDARLGHAFALFVRRALTATVSIGASYRFYIDSWDLASHSVEPDFAWSPSLDWLLRVRYRGYVQTASDAFDAATRDNLRPATYVTTDPRLSPMQTHRVGFDLERAWTLDEHYRLRGALWLGAQQVIYRELGVTRERVTVLDAVLAATFTM